MNEPTGARRRLSRWSQHEDADFPPVEAALWLAALRRPGLPETIPGHLGYLSTLADEVRALRQDRAREQREHALCTVMLRRHGFRVGNEEGEEDGDDDLAVVIERRRGAAESLGLLMLEVARRAGLAAEALAFPCRLLLRLEDGPGRRLILDPAEAGRALDAAALRAMVKAIRGLAHELEPSYFVPLGNRDMLIRVEEAVKLRLLRQGRLDRAVAVVEGLLRVIPDRPHLWREAGLMHLRRGSPREAVAALEQFVLRTTDSKARLRVLSLMAELKARPY